MKQLDDVQHKKCWTLQRMNQNNKHCAIADDDWPFNENHIKDSCEILLIGSNICVARARAIEQNDETKRNNNVWIYQWFDIGRSIDYDDGVVFIFIGAAGLLFWPTFHILCD